MCGKRLIVPLLAVVTLAVPASASAHPKSATVALDYRLVLDHATRALPNVAVRILDGDRSVRIGVRQGRLVVLGDLGEQMLRIDTSGTWVNEASVTAQAARLTKSGKGWRRIGGSTFTWHDHRLAPPPYDGRRTGTVARFVIPATLNGEHVTLGGAFVRYRRPSPWGWLAAVGLFVAAAVAATRFVPRLRPQFALALGIVAGVAALTAFVTFGVADAPNGQAAWAQIGLGLALAGAVAVALIRLDGERRVVLAGLVGAAAAAASLGSLGVFRHGVIVSVLPGAASRTVCAGAVAAGIASAAAAFVGHQGAS
jgi:hypothetical protein